ncbi:MAG: hypothetical protein PHY08_06390, partial [Candidatus Cloacimonetes bacterium]|nr:hypothetical protein [Candidatus Cloacimonadota bacterium]
KYQMDAAAAVQAFWEKEKDSIECPQNIKLDDYVPDKSRFDPRKWMIKAEDAIMASVEEMIEMVKSNQKSILG